MKPTNRGRVGFTLVELLVVIAVLAILAGLLVPALASAKGKARGVTCRGNLKQLALTWEIYADDFNQVLPHNGEIGYPSPHLMLWVYGSNHSNERALTDTAVLTDPKISLFAPYLKATGTYRCPEDRVLTLGALHARSYAMNNFISPVAGPPEDNFAFFNRSTDFRRPSDTFLMADTQPETLCMPHFRVQMGVDEWFHVPSFLHQKAGMLSYADGHVESHRWRTLASPMLTPTALHRYAAPHNIDLEWLRNRTTYFQEGVQGVSAIDLHPG